MTNETNSSEIKKYFPTSTTQCRLKIHEVRSHSGEKGMSYFASCGILTGSDRWQNIDVRFSKSLSNLADGFEKEPDTIPEGRLFDAEIKDLHFTVKPNPNDPDKPYLNSEGLLVKLSMPWF